MPRLLALLFAAMLLLAGCGEGSPAQPRVVAGALDLRHWDFDRDGVASLDGDWLLEWDEFADPRAAPSAAARPVAVPGAWHQVSGSRQGRATYRMTVQCERGAGMALSLPLQHSAARWFVNGALVARQGEPGASARGAVPAPVQQTVALGSVPCPLQIVAHVSNFDMERGGLVRSVELGDVAQLAQRRELALMRDLLAVGGLLVLGVMPLLFFLARPNDRSPLWFGLLCLVFALGMSLTGTRILQPVLAPLGWSRYLQLVFLCWYANMALFAVYVRSLYPDHVPRRAVNLIAGWVILSCLLVLATSSVVFTRLVPVLTAGSALTALYLAWCLFRAWRGGRRTARLLLGALGVLTLAVAHDISNYTHLWRLSLVPYAIMVFVGVPAYLMARRFARALLLEERMAIEQRERADLLIRSTKAGLLNWDAIANRTTYSDRFHEMLGYPVGAEGPELPEFIEQVHPDDRDAVNASFRAQLLDRNVKSGVRPGESMDYRLRRADGEYLWIHAEAVSVCDAQGRILRYICSFIDISETKRHEAEMGNRIKFINDLFDSVPLGLALRDTAGKHLFVNRTWERNIGLPRDQVLGVALRDIAITEAQAALALDREALEAPPGTTLPSREADYNGRRFMQTRTAMMDAAGKALGVLVASLDITEKFAAEQALVVEQRRLNLVVRGAQVGIVDWDGITHATYYSPRFRVIRGYAPDADTADWPDYFRVMIHPDDRERVTRRWVTFIKGKGPEGPLGDFYSPEEYRLARADGSHVWVQVSGMAVRDENGFVVRWIAAIIDITERRAQAALLEQQNEALKENVRLREEVERIGRHDIKTPLNSIVAVPRLLREERRLGPEADELLGIVERAGYRILSMVNLSLDLYKMEQGSYIFRPDAVDLADLVDKVLADLRMHAASKGVRFDVDLRGAPYAWAEELLCYSLLANLTKNAVEASPEGQAIGIRAEAGPEHSVVLHVHNRGAVPAAIRGNFFQKYATLGKASGTGLGTYSARLMARVQDGDIAMRTSDEDGTTLSVTLRAAPAGVVPTSVRHATERGRSEPLQLTGLPALRVLLVDDDEYNLLIVRRLLPAPPFTVETAINGRMALAAAERQWPDVVFMDLDMPVMGGMQAVQELRAMESASGAPRCTIIALSSHEDEATQTGALAAGFDRYLTKPVTRELVHETLLELLQGGAATPVRRLSAAPAAAVDPVLVDADMRAVLDEYLASRRQLIGGMADQLAAGEREQLRSVAHQLAGSFGLYGFKWASDQCRWIEKNFAEVDATRLDDVAGRLHAHLDTADIRFVATDSLHGEEA